MSQLGTLGSLVLSLETNLSQFKSDLGAARQAAESASKAIEQSINSANDRIVGKLQAVAAAAVSIGTIVAVKSVVEDAIHATSAFDDMAQRTGIAVEQLSKMGNVAKIGGHSLGEVEVAAGRLVKGLSAADDETKGVGKAIDALGIKARDSAGNIRPLGELMPEIARELDKYADSSSKTAVVQDLFGKSGARMIPFLKDYVELGGVAASVSAQQAAAANQLEKSWRATQLQSQQLVTQWVNEAIPTMQAVVSVMTRAGQQSDSLKSQLNTLGRDGSVASWAEETALAIADAIDWFIRLKGTLAAVGSSFLAVGGDVAVAVAAAAMAMSGGSIEAYQRFKTALDFRNKMYEEAGNRWQDLLDKDTNATRHALEEQLKLVKQQQEYANLASAFGIGMEGGKPQLNYGVPDKEAIAAAARELERLKTILASINNKDLGLEADYSEKVWFLNQQFLKGRIKTIDELRDAVIKLTAQQPAVKKAAEENNKAFDEAFELDKKKLETTEASIKAARLLTEGIEFETTALSMTNKEREIAIALRNLERDGIQKGTAAYEMFAKRIREAVEAKDGLKDQIEIWKSIEEAAHSAWQHIGEGGESVFKQLGKTLKSAVLDLLYQLTVKSWIINIGAGMAGMSPAAFATQMGTNYLGGGNGLIGAAAGYLGAGEFYSGLTGASVFAPGTAGYYGMVANSNLAAGGFGSAAAGAGIYGVGGGLVGYGITNALGAGQRGQQVGTSAGAAGALIGGAVFGPIGAIAGAVIGGLIGYFTDPDGLAQRTGKFGQLAPGQSSRDFEATSAFGRFGFSDTHWFNQDEMGDAIKGVFALETQIENAVATIATPDQRAAIIARLAAPREYNFGTEHGDFGAGLNAITRDRLGQVVGGLYPDLEAFVHAFTGTIEDLFKYTAAIIDFRSILKQVEDSGGPLAAAQRMVEDASSGMAGAAKRNEEAIRSVLEAFDGSADAAQRLTSATAGYYNAQVQLLAQIEQIKQSISDMFESTARNIKLAGLDQQGKYSFYQNEADQLFQQLLGSSDPEAIRRYAERINEDINAAFSLLSPEDQAAAGPDFLTRLEKLNEDVEGKLQDVQNDLTTRTEHVLDDVKAAFDNATQGQIDAAAGQLDAAGRQIDAANTPRRLTVELVTPGGQVTTFEGTSG